MRRTPARSLPLLLTFLLNSVCKAKLSMSFSNIRTKTRNVLDCPTLIGGALASVPGFYTELALMSIAGVRF